MSPCRSAFPVRLRQTPNPKSFPSRAGAVCPTSCAFGGRGASPDQIMSHSPLQPERNRQETQITMLGEIACTKLALSWRTRRRVTPVVGDGIVGRVGGRCSYRAARYVRALRECPCAGAKGKRESASEHGSEPGLGHRARRTRGGKGRIRLPAGSKTGVARGMIAIFARPEPREARLARSDS